MKKLTEMRYKIYALFVILLVAGHQYGQAATATIGHHTEYPGAVSIPVLVTGFTDVAAITIYFEYDPAVLGFTGYQNVPLIVSGMEANALVLNGKHLIGIIWSVSGADGVDVPDGKLIDINFNYISGSAPFTFQAFSEVVDNDLEPLTVFYTNGSISPRGFGSVILPELEGQNPNSTINIPLNVDFSDIEDGVSSFTLVVEFDDDVLQYVNIDNAALSPIEVDVLSASRIAFTWLNAGPSGSLLDGKLLDMVFQYSVGYSSLTFVEELSDMGDHNGIDVNNQFNNGFVSQNVGTVATVAAGTFTAPNAGQQVDIPVTVNFSGVPGGVSAFTFMIDFDPAVLQYQLIKTTALADIVVDIINPSRIAISWLNPDPTGSLLNGKLLDIQFYFAGGYSDISFDTDFCEMGDNNALDVNAQYTNGWVDQNPATIVGLILAKIEDAIPGSEVIIPLTVKNFDTIGGFTLHILFNDEVLNFLDIEAIIPEIEGNLLSNLINNNELALIWESGTPINLNDDVKLMDIRFFFTSGSSDLNFDLNLCEISDGAANSLFVNYTNGLVSEEAPPDVSVEIANVLAMPGLVEVPLTAQGFSNIGAFDFVISFDNTLLTFTDIEHVLTEINTDAFEYNVVGNKIFIGWNIDPAALTGLTLVDGVKLFDLQFNYVGGEADIEFDILDCTVSDFNLESKIAEFSPGSVRAGVEVSLKVFLEGFYDAVNGRMNKTKDIDTDTQTIVDKFPSDVVDLIDVELHTPGAYGTSVMVIEDLELKQDGTVNFMLLAEGGNYYITIRHRNHLETVSASPVSFSTFEVNYDFTTAASQAYGNNLRQLAVGVYGIYAGDVNRDGVVNFLDFSAALDDTRDGLKGYISNDINGDGIVDFLDFSIALDNLRSGIQVTLPSNP
jgi:hypothetical protein